VADKKEKKKWRTEPMVGGGNGKIKKEISNHLLAVFFSSSVNYILCGLVCLLGLVSFVSVRSSTWIFVRSDLSQASFQPSVIRRPFASPDFICCVTDFPVPWTVFDFGNALVFYKRCFRLPVFSVEGDFSRGLQVCSSPGLAVTGLGFVSLPFPVFMILFSYTS
jgi:hypothetical protein